MGLKVRCGAVEASLDVSAALQLSAPPLQANPADLGASTVVRPDDGCLALVVGGSSARATELQDMLQELYAFGIRCELHAHSTEALTRLGKGGVDVVIAFDDYVGRSVQRSVVEREVLVPLVTVRELPVDDPAAERLRQREFGAAESLSFDELSPSTLRVALLACVENHRAISQLQGSDTASVLEPDTGLFTALALRRRIAAAIEHAEFDQAFRYSLLYVDTREIRESHHLGASDVAALRTRVGRRLAHVANDYVAAAVDPTGYIVLFRGFDEGEDLASGETLRRELQRPYDHEDDQLHLDLGFGFARGRGLDANVDAAIARAKAQTIVPRAPRVELHHEPRPQSPTMDVLASELANALQHDEFAITYQPIVDIENEAPMGFEALIRWRHPDGQERPASEFINAANDTNLIVPIGYWCVEAAMRQMADWQQELESAKGLAISINLSAPQVLDPLFVERIRSLLMTTGLDASSVRFEIEAGTIAEHNQQARALVSGLVASGTKVWVEDYGLSECTIDDLRGFPLDGFKIDRRFVSRIDGTEMTSGRIRHIVTAAKALGLRTLGEGIENPLQANVLRWLGCSLGQGYLYSRPMSVADVYAYLASQ